MSTALQEKLDQMVREDLEDGRRMRVRDIPLTPVRGKLITANENADGDHSGDL